MAALLILNYDVRDDEKLADYREAAAPVLLAADAGRLVTSTPHTVALDEAPAAGTHTVVLRFPSVEQATRTYGSRGYRTLLAQRLRATTPRFAVIVPVTP